MAEAAPFTVFLDRDGVFNVHPRLQVRRYRDLRWLPGAREAFARLDRPGIRTCLVTNQPGTGVGLSTPGAIHRLHERFRADLQQAGGRLDRIEVCFSALPHRRRKPNPGMLEDGARALGGVDKRRAVMVGDKPKDMQAAARFGIPGIAVATTYDAAGLQGRLEKADIPYAAVVPDLAGAVELILEWAA